MEEELNQLLNNVVSNNKIVKSKKLDGICLSETAPKNTNVLWIQYNSENKFTLNIYWCNHWHPICSEAGLNEIIRKIKQLFTSNINDIDTRIIQLINEKFKKVTYVDDYIDIDINPLSDEMIERLLFSVYADEQDLIDLTYENIYPISIGRIIEIVEGETSENYGDTGN